MDMFDFAGLLFGGNRNRSEATTVTATGAAASNGGVASITLDADVTPAEDVGEDADQTVIDLPTSPDVDEGDEVIVTLVGDGPLKTPVVTANPGSGDRMRALANSAKTIANAAQAVAEAVNQHFFADTSGIHVTEATQEDWNDNHSGANVLINSIGQLFRDGLNNLLTLTTENGARALTIWDGLGNAASNVVASFSENGIGLAGDAFHLSSTKTTEEWGDEQNPTLVEDTKSNMHMESGNDSYTIRSRIDTETSIGEGSGGYGYTNGHMILGVDVEDENGNTLAQPSVEIYADPETSQFRATADDIELNGSGMFSMSGNQFIVADSHNGVNMWSTAPGTVLWSSGGWAMAANQTATLAHGISTCPTGIALHWQPYTSSTVRNYFHQWQFIPKEQVASFAGTTVDVTLSSSKFASVATKTLYVSDNRVTGHDDNTATGTANGITYANNQWVLTQIIAV